MMQNLEQKAREERNAYYRAWRAKNKSRVKAINQRYWEKRARKTAELNGEERNNDR